VEPGVGLQEYESVDDTAEGDGAQHDEDVGEGDDKPVQEDHHRHRPGRKDNMKGGAAFEPHPDLFCKIVSCDRHVDEHRREGCDRRPDDPEEGDEGEVEEDVHDCRRAGGIEGLPGAVDCVEAHRLEVHENVDDLHQEEDGEGGGARGEACAIEIVEEAVAEDPAPDSDRDGEEKGVGDGARQGEGDEVEGAISVPAADLGVEGRMEGQRCEGGGGGELEGSSVDADIGGGHEVTNKDCVGVRKYDGTA